MCICNFFIDILRAYEHVLQSVVLAINRVCVCVCVYIYIYTECNRRNGPNFGRVFLMLNYTEKTQNTSKVERFGR
jgi:hypothetical protein